MAASIHISGHHREYSYHVRHTVGHERADVDIFSDDNRHYSFELAVISRNPKTLPDALRETVRCWIDGIFNRLEAAQ